MDEIKKGWKIVVFTMLISNIGLGAFAFFKNTPTKEYVDNQDKVLQNQVNNCALKTDMTEMKEQINFMYQEAYKKAHKNDK